LGVLKPFRGVHFVDDIMKHEHPYRPSTKSILVWNAWKIDIRRG
jgi:hypothetical protein